MHHATESHAALGLKSARILPDAKHSNHYPVVMELED
jgi:exonuclease III